MEGWMVGGGGEMGVSGRFRRGRVGEGAEGVVGVESVSESDGSMKPVVRGKVMLDVGICMR